MSRSTLVAFLDGTRVATITMGRSGVLELQYDDSWRQAPDAYPISLSMPLAGRVHPHDRIDPYLWGLLPDNPAVLEGWSRQFQVSPRNAFGLLSMVGEECAGAIQLVPPERIPAVARPGPRKVSWLDEAGVAERLRSLKRNPAAVRRPGDTGQFSLAGAQPKTALFREGSRWAVPEGRTPTTHILKPPSGDLQGFAENEHLCLSLLRALGLPAASTSVERFQDEHAIVVERYDRLRPRGSAEVLRIHQEDLCQASGLPPTRRYQAEGGPSPASIVELLRRWSTRAEDDVATFVDALALNWLIGGTDAHGKNYSLLLTGRSVRLAPLYDVASVLPYPELDPRRMKLAMKIGGKYRLREIGRRQWEKEAAELRLAPDAVIARIDALAERLPDAVAEVRKAARRDGLRHPIVDRLAAALTQRAAGCRRELAG